MWHPVDDQTDVAVAEVAEVLPEEIPWLWIGIGSGAVIAILAGVALAKRRRK